MKNFSKVILKIFGWKTVGEFPNLKKSVVIIAPHTSNWDIVLGKLYMGSKGISNKVLVKKELFFFPLKYIMKIFGTVPVDRYDKKNNVVYQATSFFEKNEKFCLVVSAEGTRSKVTRWKQGFYYIAQKANVPIVVSYMDYKKKEVGVKEVITDLTNTNEVMKQIIGAYKNVTARFPENFVLDKRFL